MDNNKNELEDNNKWYHDVIFHTLGFISKNPGYTILYIVTILVGWLIC